MSYYSAGGGPQNVREIAFEANIRGYNTLPYSTLWQLLHFIETAQQLDIYKCINCGVTGVWFHEIQSRIDDGGSIMIFFCDNCGARWREY